MERWLRLAHEPTDVGAALPAHRPLGRGPAGWRRLPGRGVLVVAEVELVELGVGAVGGEIGAGLAAAVEDEGVLVELDEARREDRAHERPERRAERLFAAGEGVAQLARHAL